MVYAADYRYMCFEVGQKGEVLLGGVDRLEECSTGNRPVPPDTAGFGLAQDETPDITCCRG